jgi:multiple sugar transport system permease protein
MAVSVRKRRSRGLLGKGRRRGLGRVLLYVAVIVIAIWSLFPFLYMLNVSLSDTTDVVAAPPRWFPWPVKFKHWYRTLFETRASGTHFGSQEEGITVHHITSKQVFPSAMRSVVVALGTTILNLVIGSFAGYGMARYPKFWFVDASMNLMMITRMLPGLALLIPFFVIYRITGLMNTLQGLIIAYTSFILPLTVYVMRGYFASIPKTLEWSAQVDGCNWLQAFWRIFLPVSAPGLVAAAIFTFLVAWNEFLFALLLVPRRDVNTVTVTLVSMISSGSNVLHDYPALYVGGVMAVIPPVFIAFVFQRYLIQGLLSGAMKG